MPIALGFRDVIFVFALVSACLRVSRCIAGDLSLGDIGNGTAETVECPEGRMQVVLLERPPYVKNATATSNTKLGMIYMLFGFFQEYTSAPCSQVFNYQCVNITKTKDEYEQYTYVAKNTSDLVFPVIYRKGTTKLHQKPLLDLLDHPGMSLLVIPKAPDPVGTCLQTITSSWPLLALSVIFTGISGIIIWLCEAMSNRDEFPTGFTKGCWEGFWWAFISMTTVGYGDKSPRTVAGRCFSVVWIFVGLVIVAVFMANITTALTSISVKPNYDLSHMEVAVFRNSTDEMIARDEGAKTKAYDSFAEMVTALKDKAVDGILADRFTTSYYMRKAQDNNNKLNFTLAKQITIVAYSIGIAVGTKRAVNLLNGCGVLTNGVFSEENVVDWADLRYRSTEYGQKNLALLKKSSSSPSATHFNLFMDSRDAIHFLVYVSLGVLAAMLMLGFGVEFIMNKKLSVGQQTVELFEMGSVTNSTTKNTDERLQKQIAEGKKMLQELQSHFDNLEQLLKNRHEPLTNSKSP